MHSSSTNDETTTLAAAGADGVERRDEYRFKSSSSVTRLDRAANGRGEQTASMEQKSRFKSSSATSLVKHEEKLKQKQTAQMMLKNDGKKSSRKQEIKRRSSSVMTTTTTTRRGGDQLPPSCPTPPPLYSNASVSQKAAAATTITASQTTTTPSTATPHQLSKINGMFIRDEIGVEFFHDVLGSAEMINKNFTPVRIVKRSDSYEYAGVINTMGRRGSGGGGLMAARSNNGTPTAAAVPTEEGPIRSMARGFVSEQPNTSRNLMNAPSPVDLFTDDLDLMTSDFELDDEDVIDKTWSVNCNNNMIDLNNAVLDNSGDSGKTTTTTTSSRTAETYRTASDNINNNEYMEVVDDELRQLDEELEKQHYVEPIIPAT